MPVSKGSVVGIEYAQVWRVGADGFGTGQVDPASPGANPVTSHALFLPYPKSAGVPSPARVVAALTGGDRWIGQVMFGISDMGSFPFMLNDLNGVLHALATESAVDATTNSRWRRYSDNKNKPLLPQLGLLLTAIYQSREDASDGFNYYVNYIIPRCQIDPSQPELSFQSAVDTTYTVSPTLATKEPHGLTFADGAMSLHQNKAWMYCIVSEKPLAYTAAIMDGIATDITLGYLPSSDVITLNAAANELALNGTLTALTSASITTGVAVLAAAGSDDDQAGILYETEFEAVP